MPSDFSCKPGDVVVALDDPPLAKSGNRWTVIDAAWNRLKQTWRLTTRNLALVVGMSDEIQIERATLSTDAAGAPVKTFPVPVPPAAAGLPYTFTGGIILYRLIARVQPQRTQVDEERGIRGPKTLYDVIVPQQVLISTEDRIRWGGQYLEIVGYRQAERIDELPIVEAALLP
jgi:hypothetical protein